jgi:hypothetical protein
LEVFSIGLWVWYGGEMNKRPALFRAIEFGEGFRPMAFFVVRPRIRDRNGDLTPRKLQKNCGNHSRS